jgi:uncharacterized Zn finger protein
MRYYSGRNCGGCGGFLMHVDLPCPRCGFATPRTFMAAGLNVVQCENCGADVRKRLPGSKPEYCTACGVPVRRSADPKDL